MNGHDDTVYLIWLSSGLNSDHLESVWPHHVILNETMALVKDESGDNPKALFERASPEPPGLGLAMSVSSIGGRHTKEVWEWVEEAWALT